MFEDYQTKPSVVVVFTGEGKGKTSAALGLMVRALGAGQKVAFIQFIKNWAVSEHNFIEKIMSLYKNDLFFYKGGQGFVNAGDLSAKNIDGEEHKLAALKTYKIACEKTQSGDYDLVICDEINNALNEGLLSEKQLRNLIKNRDTKTSLCLTGRNFSPNLLKLADIVTDMTKIKHHYDQKHLANRGIDY